MSKIHELIAVMKDVEGKAKDTRGEVAKLFAAGEALFQGQTRLYTAKADVGAEVYPPEIKNLAMRVGDQLKRVRTDVGRLIDLDASKEASNSKPEAKASVTIEGEIILADLPVTELLNLEQHLVDLRSVYAAIPTNDVLTNWTWDAGNNVWRSQPVETVKTKKVAQKFVKAEATDKHPAQVDIISVDEREGTWTAEKQSGMLSPAQKTAMLERLETLLRAVRTARQRANETEAADAKVAAKIFDYIEGVGAKLRE